MMLSKCCSQYVSKFGRPSSGHRNGKGQFSSQFPRMNVQTIRQLHSSPMLAKSCLKSWRTKNFQPSKLGLEKAEEPEIKLPTLAGSQRKQRNSRKTSTFVSLTTLNKACDCVDHLTCLLRNLHGLRSNS